MSRLTELRDTQPYYDPSDKTPFAKSGLTTLFALYGVPMWITGVESGEYVSPTGDVTPQWKYTIELDTNSRAYKNMEEAVSDGVGHIESKYIFARPKSKFNNAQREILLEDFIVTRVPVKMIKFLPESAKKEVIDFEAA